MGGKKIIYLQRHGASRGGFPSSADIPVPPALRLALDKLPPPRSGHAPAVGNRSSREIFNGLSNPASAGHPPPGGPVSEPPAPLRPVPPPLLAPLSLAEPCEKAGRCYIYIYIYTPGKKGALVLNPNKPTGLVLGTLPGILLPSS